MIGSPALAKRYQVCLLSDRRGQRSGCTIARDFSTVKWTTDTGALWQPGCAAGET